MQVSKEVCRRCMDGADDALLAGKYIHRVARKLFAPGAIVRQELEVWLESGAPLNSFSHAHEALLEYALCGLAERAVEGVHAVIKRFGMASRS